jgi:two-component system, OmpR family, sensor kinase
MAIAMGAISVVSVFTLEALLDREIDATILNVASIQAASLTDEPTGDMHFHEWALTPDEAASVRELVRYAQVWQSDGTSLLRSRYMTADLPLDTLHLRRAGEGELVWTRSDFGGLPVRVLYYPLERFGVQHQRHVLEVAAPLESRNAMVSRVSVFLALLTVLVTGATFAGSWWLAGRAIRPVSEVIDQAEEIGARSLDRRIHAYADTREYRRLVDVLNTMLSRLQGAFEAQRRFTADASHELRSPLTAMRGELELALRRDREAGEYRRVIGSTLEEVVRLSRITEDLLVLARSDSGALQARPEPTDMEVAVERVVERLGPKATEKELSVEVSVEGDVTAVADPVLVGQVAWNLLDNAIKFSPSGGSVFVSVVGNPDSVTLTVRDHGPGFPPDGLGQLFTRFYRGDPARSRLDETAGTGLGLAIVEAVAEAHGGEVSAANREGGGAVVSVRFPRIQFPKSQDPQRRGT